MKQLLYIPSGRYFKFYDNTWTSSATWSIEEYLKFIQTLEFWHNWTHAKIVQQFRNYKYDFTLYNLAEIPLDMEEIPEEYIELVEE